MGRKESNQTKQNILLAILNLYFSLVSLNNDLYKIRHWLHVKVGMDEYFSLNIQLYFHNFLHFTLVCRLCMLAL